MQFGDGLDRRAAGWRGFDLGQTKLKRGKGIVIPTGSVMLLTDPQPMRAERARGLSALE